MTLRIATWNINSIRIRQDLIARGLKTLNADILCLQETKVNDPDFPLEQVRGLGFRHIYYKGQKSYNGMAILSHFELEDVHSEDMIKNDEKRHLGGRLPDGSWIHNFYVPAGGDIPDAQANPKFRDKLAFVDAMKDWSREHKDGKAIIVGDFNIAPYEHDVWSHKQLLGVVSHTPIETDKMGALRESVGWVDVARQFVPMDQKLYSWWSYRNRDWAASDRGRRLDHIWVTPNLKSQVKSIEVLREARGFENPSDHVPVVMELA